MKEMGQGCVNVFSNEIVIPKADVLRECMKISYMQ